MMNSTLPLLYPDWPAPANVKAFQTTREGGLSLAPYNSLNLGTHVGDQTSTVIQNRMRLNTLLPSEPVWLEQVHGTEVIIADKAGCLPQADACIARRKGAVCVIMTADCLPVLLCNRAGTVVAAVHAGWKGLLNDIISKTVQQMDSPVSEIIAWLGPAISQAAFEVGDEVYQAFTQKSTVAKDAFIAGQQPNKWQADLYELARQELKQLGIQQISGGEYCTFSQTHFFSYRRDQITGRMGSFIWLE